MSITVKLWSEVPQELIEKLFLTNPFPLYRNTPLATDLIKKYMYRLAQESAAGNKKTAMVAVADGKPVVTGQVYPTPYLSNHWNISIGGLNHMVVGNPMHKTTPQAALALIEGLIDVARLQGMSFVSTSVPAANISLVRALEKNGFMYAEGFINMVGPTHHFRDQFTVPGLNIREPIERDFFEIAEAYQKVYFPNRFATDGGFEPEKAMDLYVRRFKEVHEQKLGKVFIAEIEARFAGAIIAIIDERMAKMIGVKTNILSGMGIIIHPRAARRGVSMALIEHRQDYYKSEGVEYVSFGANFNNKPMISGLEKLGLRYGSLDMTLHRWLR